MKTTSFPSLQKAARAAVTACLLLVMAAAVHAASIVDSKHNLAISGAGLVKSVGETEVCIFCHTPHNAANEVPQWNRAKSVQHYTPYSSTTLKATDVGQPTGASKLCLSCHDGTVALGKVSSKGKSIQMRNSVTTIPVGRSRMGTDLSDDHPISFKYDAALASANTQLKDPSTLNRRVRLDDRGEVQCTSCHDPHNNQYGSFLVQNNAGSALCLECHAPLRWNESIHKTSAAAWNGKAPDPWPHTAEQTVAGNGCAGCHTPHLAGTPQRLLNFPMAEQNCHSCHNGNVAEKNIQAEFSKFSVHPVITTGDRHDAAEDLINPPRHVACVDCHNPHAVQASPPGSLHAPGSLVGVKGVNSQGSLVNPITREFELCYRCHADSVGRAPAAVSRHVPQTNKRLQFSTGNASFHPVETVGRNSSVPSLIAPWTASSLVTCTDCHANNQGPGAGGTGPRGPHGSAFSPILERQLITADNQPESEAAYALCYKCHSRSSILNDESYKGHRKHIVDERTACSTCHDSHGVQGATHLINFNSLYVTPSSNGRLEFVDKGASRGECSLTCHGKDHTAWSYEPTGVAPALLKPARGPARPRR
jgi:predicted CXXCH cytochrome family protein